MNKNFPIGTVAVFVIFLLTILIVTNFVTRKAQNVPQELTAVLRPAPKSLQAFSFTDHSGKLYTQENLRGKWTFLFFGYTYCPDVCPATLNVLASLSKHLSSESDLGKDAQVVFVSIDPQRDKPEVMAKYLGFFSKDFIGISAEPDKTQGLASQFGAMFFRQKGSDPNNYLMAHASSIYLVNPRAELIASFSPPHNHKLIASQFQAIRDLLL